MWLEWQKMQACTQNARRHACARAHTHTQTICEFEETWKMLDPDSTGLLACWKLQTLCHLLVQGQNRGGGQRRPCALAEPLRRRVQDGGVSVTAMHNELKRAHAAELQQRRAEARDAGEDLSKAQVLAWSYSFRYELVLRQFVGVCALRQVPLSLPSPLPPVPRAHCWPPPPAGFGAAEVCGGR